MEMHNNKSNEELDVLDKKIRHIIYKKHKLGLMNVLRYNYGGVIMPKEIEIQVRNFLTKTRENNKNFKDKQLMSSEGKKIYLQKEGRYRTITYDNKTYRELETQGNTYTHTMTQGIMLYKYGTQDLEKGVIDYQQFRKDIIRNNRHDVSEKITDDLPKHKKNEDFKKREKEIEEKMINNIELEEDEKNTLKEIMKFNKNESRFKIFEYMGFINDMIEVIENKEKYNEIYTVIYEVLQNILPLFLKEITLDNGQKLATLQLPSIKSFFLDNQEKINNLFKELEENKNKLTHETRRKEDHKGQKINIDKTIWEIIQKKL